MRVGKRITKRAAGPAIRGHQVMGVIAPGRRIAWRMGPFDGLPATDKTATSQILADFSCDRLVLPASTMYCSVPVVWRHRMDNLTSRHKSWFTRNDTCLTGAQKFMPDQVKHHVAPSPHPAECSQPRQKLKRTSPVNFSGD